MAVSLLELLLRTFRTIGCAQSAVWEKMYLYQKNKQPERPDCGSIAVRVRLFLSDPESGFPSLHRCKKCVILKEGDRIVRRKQRRN